MLCWALKCAIDEWPLWVIQKMKANREPMPSTQKNADAHPARARTLPPAPTRMSTVWALAMPMAPPRRARTATRTRSLPAVGMPWR